MNYLARLLLPGVVSLSVLFGMTVNALAQEGEPAATFSFTTTAVQVGVGVTWGEGTLYVGDQVYAFDVTGLNMVGVGVSTAVVQGKVDTLQSAEDFAGTYKGEAMGMTIGGGGTSVKLTNDKGVMVEVTTESEGVQLNIGVDGLKVKDVRLVKPE
jgi:hypothetical protein